MKHIAFPKKSREAVISVGDYRISGTVEKLSREERFMATVYAMNTLLIRRGIYTQAEFDALFCEWARAQIRRDPQLRIPHPDKLR